MDKRLRRLQRQALGGPTDELRYYRTLFQAGRLPSPLEPFVGQINPNILSNSAMILMFLETRGIPYALRPNGICGCENSACIPDHPSEEYPDLPGPCSRLAIRGYDDLIGGYCEICIDRIPAYEHSTMCGCRHCMNNQGPLITLRSRLMTSEELTAGSQAYEKVYGPDWRLRIHERPMSAYQQFSKEQLESNIAISLQWGGDFSEFDRRLDPDPHTDTMDALASCYVVVQEEGFLLKRIEQPALNPRYFHYIEECQRMLDWSRGVDPELARITADACNYLLIHLMGRQFTTLTGLWGHLARHRPPNMHQFIAQLQNHLSGNIDFTADQDIAPTDLAAVIAGAATPLGNRQVIMRLTREAWSDRLHVRLATRTFGHHYFFNKGQDRYGEGDTAPERIVRSLGWDAEREGVEIQEEDWVDTWQEEDEDE